MTKDDDFKLLKIQTCVLKVNIHCDGCKQKVKKLLQRIEGVYQVKIDAEHQKVTVSGSVDSATLIKKLIKAGKHAEIWSQKSNNQNQKQKSQIQCIKDDKNNKSQNQGLIKNQQKFPTFISEEDDDDYFDDDDEEEDEDEDEELKILREKVNQLGLLRQQAMGPNSGKKVVGGAPNNGKINVNLGNGNGNGNGNVGKKGNPNQNMGLKGNPVGIDQKTMAALKFNNNPHLGGGGGGGGGGGEGNRGNDINAMMGLAGFHGNTGGNIGNLNGLGGFQIHHPNSGLVPNGGGGGPGTGHYNPSAMMMNMNNNGFQQNRHVLQQQPQMMYQRSPFVPTNTGYYYNYNYTPAPYGYSEPNNCNGDQSATTHMFSDENTSSCSIM